AHVITASADYEILSPPATLAETEQVKDLQRQDAGNLRVDQQLHVVPGISTYAGKPMNVIANYQPSENCRKLKPERPHFPAKKEALITESLVKGQQNHSRLASGYLTPVISSQQLSLFYTLKVSKPRLHAEAIFLPSRMPASACVQR